MPRVSNWDEFAEKADKLYSSDPVNSRITIKYRHQDGKLALKATDNKTCVQYVAEQAKEVKNMDKFMTKFIRKCAE